MLTSTVGSASPSSSWAHGHVANGWSPYQSVTPTGVTPRASTKSCSVTPTVTTRCGSSSTTVVPRACSTVAGNVPVLGGGGGRRGGRCRGTGRRRAIVVVVTAAGGDRRHEEQGDTEPCDPHGCKPCLTRHGSLQFRSRRRALRAHGRGHRRRPVHRHHRVPSSGLRQLYRRRRKLVAEKKLDHLAPWARAMIGAARFVFLATADRDGPARRCRRRAGRRASSGSSTSTTWRSPTSPATTSSTRWRTSSRTRPSA